MKATTCSTHRGIVRPCRHCEPEARAALQAQQHPPEEPAQVGPYGLPLTDASPFEEEPMDDATVLVLEQAARRNDYQLRNVADVDGTPETGTIYTETGTVADITDAFVPDKSNTMTIPEEGDVTMQVGDFKPVVVGHFPPMQPTLSDELFPPVRRADVPMVKVSVSGTIELTQDDYQAHLDGQRLGPGAVVEIRAAGYVVQPGAAWVKRSEKDARGDPQEWYEREGRVKIKLTDLGELAPTGEEWSE